ncbi:MAG: TATA-box-binding protein [Thermoprotei archaeon]|nr:MAG: TATA-box-binding protein [Thermoprotei archaeon]
MPKPTYRIENIVATVNLHCDLDLDELAERLPNAEYNPEQFPGLILRLQKPKVSTLIFRTGKIVCTGAKSENELKRAVKALVKMLKEHGANIPGEPEVKIQNVVASANLHAEVDIEKAALLLENCMYEPEQFPGLIYRMDEPRVVLLIFSSGKMVCTGAKKEDQVREAVEKIYYILRDLGVLYEEER